MANDRHEEQSQSGAAGGNLFSDFPVPSYEEWKASAEKMLKGAPFEKRLVSRTHEGIDLQPMYLQDAIEGLPHLDSFPGFPPYLRGTGPAGHTVQAWRVAQEIPCALPEEVNAALRSDLERGQDALNLVLDRATLMGCDADQAQPEDVGRGGVSISCVDDFATLLDGVDLSRTPIYIQANTSALALSALLIAVVRRKGASPEVLEGSVGMDPLGALAVTGSLPRSLDGIYDVMAQLTTWASKHAPKLKTITIEAHPYHDSGASATQDLAFSLATGVEYLREMQARGLAIDTAAAHMRFSFSLGSNLFMEMARLRAARVLWATIVSAFGGSAEAQKMNLHARTSHWNKTAYDAHVNLLRTTTEAFSGIMGGADSLHIGAFDEVIRTPDEFSRRIARNTHTVLREESHLNGTADPAGGSWYIEWLTNQVAEKSWALFQEVEKHGGMFKALEAGFPQSAVEKVAQGRAANAGRRKEIFVGTNMYPNLNESPIEAPVVDHAGLQSRRAKSLEEYRALVDADWRDGQLERLSSGEDNVVEAAIQAASAGATLGQIAKAARHDPGVAPSVKPVNLHRGAAAFEALRKATEQYGAETGSRPKVFLANMGPIPQHKARADFSTGFLEVGAFETLGNEGFADVEAAAQAALDSGAPVVVICSTDATYPDIVPQLTARIKAANPDTVVLLAGYPADHVEAFKQAGVDDFIHLRADCYSLLRNLQEKVGIAL